MDCSIQEVWVSTVFPSLETSWVALVIKALSLWGEKDYPNLRRIPFNKAFITSDALSDLHGHASTHPVKVSTNSSRYRSFPAVWDIPVKSICQSYRGPNPQLALDSFDFWGGGGPIFGLFLAQMVHF